MATNVTFLRKYTDGSLRIITKSELQKGDEIVFQNERWESVTRIIQSVNEKRLSRGQYKVDSERPLSYSVSVL